MANLAWIPFNVSAKFCPFIVTLPLNSASPCTCKLGVGVPDNVAHVPFVAEVFKVYAPPYPVPPVITADPVP